MSISSVDRKKAWDARIQRINSGRTMTQCADAEGTVPIQYAKRGQKGPLGLNGVTAWFLGGAFGWAIGTGLSVASPAAQILDKYDLGEQSWLVASYADPVLGFLAFMFVLSFLRINGFLAKLLGVVMMAWVFALQAGMGVPTVPELLDVGHSVIAGEFPLEETVVALREWAVTTFA